MDKSLACRSYNRYMAAMVTDWLRQGWSADDMATALQVTPRTMKKWLATRDDLKEAVIEASRPRDAEAESAMYELATGAVHERAIEHFAIDPESGTLTCVSREVQTEKLAPDFKAAAFILKNRRGDRWHDRQEHDVRSVGITMHIDAKDAEL